MAPELLAPVARLTRLFGRAPAWVSTVLGVVAFALGLYLVVRPLSSLTVLVLLIGFGAIAVGGGEILGVQRSPTPRISLVLGVAWIAVGVFVLASLGRAVDIVAVVAAVALLVSGILRLAGLVRGTVDERITAGCLAVAEVVLGVVALRWPDVTLLVVAVVFGIRLAVFGAAQIWDAVNRGRRPTEVSTTARERGRWARYGKVVAAATALVLALGAAGLSATLRHATPTIDAFYQAPDDVPSEPGKLLRAEPFTREIPDTAQAWRILYTTTRDDGVPALASAIVLVARDVQAGPRPVIAWAHGTTGFAQPCAPSLLDHPLDSGALPALDDIVSRGWVLVATDYIGLGTEGPHPYLIGQGEGRSVLDAVRAARQLDGVDMSDQTVVWGHSQGGHAALWTGQLAPGYAPDVGVIGVAAIAPAADAVGVTATLDTVAGGSVFGSYVIAAYTRIYPDVDFDTYVAPAARTLVNRMSERCLSEPGVFVSVLSALSLSRDRPILRTDPTTGPFGERLRENVPAGAMPVPVLIAQGESDTLIDPEVQDRYVAQRCADGWNIDYRTYPDRDHVGVVAEDSPLMPDLLAWTQARFDRQPQQSNC